MHASVSFRRRRRHTLAEPLERRSLMSAGSWTTIVQDPNQTEVNAMATDNAGAIYAVSNPGAEDTLLKAGSNGQWAVLATADNHTSYAGIAADAAGDVFVAGARAMADGNHWSVWEEPAGQSGLTMIDDLPGVINANAITTNAQGNVYVAGVSFVTTTVRGKTTTTDYEVIRKLTPTANGFAGSTVYQGAISGLGIDGISIIPSGASAGIYAVGSIGNYSWGVLKGGTTGTNWALVDQFAYDPNVKSNVALAATGDGAGHVYVTGLGFTRVLTGYSYTKVKGQSVATPIYNNDIRHWLVRSSSSGNSGTWSTVDDFEPSGSKYAQPAAIGADLAGNIYVTGTTNINGVSHGIVRTNAGGSWSISDDYTGIDGTYAEYTALAVDPNGDVYVGGDDDGGTLVRERAALETTGTSVLFSSTWITGDSGLTKTTRSMDDLLGTTL